MHKGIIKDVTDYIPPTAAELEMMVRPLPPRQRSAMEKAATVAKAEKVLVDSAMDVVKELVALATNASSEKVRLEASKYILDRVAGKIMPAAANDAGAEKPFWEDVLGTVVREPSKYELDGTVVDES
jgi:hypothetical protein